MGRATGWVRTSGVVAVTALAVGLTSAAALESGGWRDGAALTQARSGATASLLNDGRVLFAGGSDGATALASAEVLGAHAAAAVGSMSQPRSRHAAGLLPDGRVLVVGGELLSGLATDSAELFDPATSSWSAAAGLSGPRAGHTITALHDGSLLVAGGDSVGGPSALLEIFDPVAESFYVAGVLATPRTGHAAAQLDDGRVLIAGGSDGTAVLASTEIYNPMTGEIGPGPDLRQARTALTATSLIDGRVLVVGGSDGSGALATAELIDAEAGASAAVAAGLMAPRQGHLAFRLPNNNNVLIVSGDSPVTPLASAELFTPVTGGFDATGAMVAARAMASGTALSADGQLIIGGGAAGDGALGSSEIYVFQTIRTDRADYAPGETVTFIGRRWQPGETVTLVLHETPRRHEVQTLTAVADANGDFVNTDYAPEDHDLGTRYVVDAIGQDSGLTAQAAFTDGNIKILASFGSFTAIETRYASADCSGASTAGSTETVGTGGKNYGLGNRSHRFTASLTGTGSGGSTTAFTGWTCTANTHLGAPTSGNAICVLDTNPNSGECVANYSPASATTATTVTTSPNPSVFGQAVTANVSVTRTSGASGTPTGTVAVSAAGGGSCVATLSGSGATATGSCGLGFASTGARLITASYAGTASFNASSGTVTHTVNKASTDVTLAAPASVVVGQSFSATASVAAVAPGAGTPGGTIDLSNGTSSCSVPAAGGTCSLTAGGAGSATVSATYAGDARFNGSGDAQAQAVAKAATTTAITSDEPDASVVGEGYVVTWTVTVNAPGAGTPTGTVTVTGGSGCSAPVGDGQCTVTSTSAGGVALMATYSGDANFNLSAGGASHTVDPAATATAVTSSLNPSIFGEAVTFTAEVCVTGAGTGQPTGFVEFFAGATSLGTRLLTPVAGDCPAAGITTAALASGTHTVTAQYATDGDFAGSSGSLSQFVGRKAATVRANDKTKTYGDANPALDATVTGTLGGDTLAYSLGTAALQYSNVGGHAIVVTPGSNPNYDVTAVNGTLTIQPRGATITADPQTKTYGNANPHLTATVSGTVNGDALAYTLATTAEQFSDVGPYPITVSLQANPNYEVTAVDGTLTVTAKAATVTAHDKTKTYGDLNPPLTATVEGAVSGGDAIDYTLETSATQYSSVAGSPYAITVGLGDNPNYEVSVVNAELTVTRKAATVTAGDRSKVYGDVVTFGGTEFTASGFVSTDAVSSVSLASAGAGATAGVPGSPYAIVASDAQGSGLDNYAISYVDGALAVTRKAATVTANDAGKLYGDANPAFGAAVTGTVNGDLLDYGFATAAGTLSGVGGYAIDVTLGSNPNYEVAAVSGTLFIAPRPASVTAEAKERAFGDLNPTLAAVVVGQVTGGDVIQYTLATTAGQFSNVGSYPITVTLGTNPNYAVTKTDSQLTVRLRAVVTTVSVAPNPQQYSDLVTFTATADAGGLTDPAAASSVTFRIGTQVMGTDSTAAIVAGKLVWTLESALLEPGFPSNGQMAPGNRAVTALFGGTNANFDIANATTTLAISQEDARVTYTGSTFVGTGSATTGTATLSATIQDIGATGDAAGDASFGDIRNATVKFVNRDGGAVLCTAPIGLVSASDTRTGTATCNATLSVGNSNSASYTVGVVVGGYYVRDASTDNSVVTVAQGGTGFITGGGYLVLQSSSGIYPGAAGSKNNFGFNVKYNKQKTNLQGHINTIVRNNGRVYQVKGNAMTSLAVQPSAGTAQFTGKASIQDITDPLAAIAIDGNATLQVTMTDNGEPGTTDAIGIAVYNKNGGLWFSSNWSGTKTQEQVLKGGNLVVH